MTELVESFYIKKLCKDYEKNLITINQYRSERKKILNSLDRRINASEYKDR